MRAVARRLGLACAVWLALVASFAAAAPCGRPDVDFTFPPDQADNVPPNAELSAHYASPALYAGEAVSLTNADGEELEASARYDEAESLLRVTPEQALPPGEYELVWPGLHSVSGGGTGRGSSAHFSVKSTPDSAPPTFAGLENLTWDLARDRDPCLDRLDDRFVFELGLGSTSDDSDVDLLTVHVFETRAPSSPDQSAPAKLALRPFPQDGTLEVRRPADDAGDTCFAAVVQDLAGNVSGGGEVEVCVKTKRPPFFDGCSLTAEPGSSHGRRSFAWGAALSLAIALLRRGTSARSPRRRALG